MAETILVVSPHLDDAVLSVGGSIATWTAAGKRVAIASVYTTGPPLGELAPSMRKFADYTTRRAEDAAACAVVGAQTHRLAQIERAFRKPYLTGWSFFATPASRDGFSRLGAVTRALDATLAKIAPDRILIPLGVGNHVDHVEALVAATDATYARGWRDRVWFYEDFYALSGTMRRRHPVARTRTWRSWQAPLLHARRLAIVLQTIAAARRGPDVERFLDPALRDATWTVERSAIDLDRKLAAIACYASQTRAFGGLAGIDRALRAYHAWWGNAEPLWRAGFAPRR
jgi:LmbE family N-acetylglucosaminyl deacetylase